MPLRVNDSIFMVFVEKEVIIKYRFQWAEADEDPQDNRLTFDEFTNFRHPEQSKAMLSRMVKHLIDKFGRPSLVLFCYQTALF